jgi:uncharacterized membrane-anchored protein
MISCDFFVKRLAFKVLQSFYCGITWFEVVLADWLVFYVVVRRHGDACGDFQQDWAGGRGLAHTTCVRAGIMFAAIVVLILVTVRLGNFHVDSKSLFCIALAG